MIYSGARIVIECLVEQGVDTVFGYPGGSILNVYDELYNNAGRIRHILTAHEQGAAHAADGYARATGRPGVVLATSGPGATNLVTGIAAAYMDSSPLVAITCNVSSHLLGRDSFQEVSITGVTMPITKHNYIVRRVEDLASTMREAFAIAVSGRPGPVLVDIPKDITVKTAHWEPAPALEAGPRRFPSEAELAEAVRLICEAERPLILSGGGVVGTGSGTRVAALADALDIPVALTLMGHGGFPSRHPRCTGMVGMHGTRASNLAAHRADLILAVGARFSDRVICDAARFAQDARVIHLDIDPAEIGKNVYCDVGLVGELPEVLDALLDRLPRATRAAWMAEVEAWKAGTPRPPRSPGKIAPDQLMEEVARRAGEEAIITTEVGQHQMWTAQYYPFSRPRTFISSGGLGAMGFGTGAAIGAQVGNPGRRVVHIAGDGSFRMNCAELATISHYRLPIVIIVANNGVLGMVRQWQKLFYEGRFSETMMDRGPDFVKLAEAYGIPGFSAQSPEELGAALDAAFAVGGPALIDCGIGRDEEVLPIVPPGKHIADQVLEAVSP